MDCGVVLGFVLTFESNRFALTHPPTEIMELHHKKHHQAYVTNFNAALEKLAAAEVRQRNLCWGGSCVCVEAFKGAVG